MPTDAVDLSAGNKVLKGGIMSNLEVCQKRAPEEAAFKTEKVSFGGTVTIPAKAFVVISF